MLKHVFFTVSSSSSATTCVMLSVSTSLSLDEEGGGVGPLGEDGGGGEEGGGGGGGEKFEIDKRTRIIVPTSSRYNKIVSQSEYIYMFVWCVCGCTAIRSKTI